jgi:excisionase family DNA binding protein
MREHKGWYTISDLATQISLSRKTIWAWVRDGKLRSARYGSQHRITEADWQRLLAACNPQNDNQL